MAEIRVLNDRLINKIAAGEVVERPASALKELLENSLDAGARELRVDLEAGGKRLIRVVDDGAGMDSDDILMALERHATSKIRQFEDLEEVVSLGFRGEALPSIAAVSRMVLRSRPVGAAEGREVTVDGGVIKGVKPCAMAPGTSVEARSLFYNVPARRKFLRTTPTEYGQCQGIATQYALAFPEINLMLRHNGATQINATPTNSVKERIAQVLGSKLLERLVQFELNEGETGIVGFAGEPALHRSDASMLHFFVNRRAVRDKVLMHAVREAYGDLLPKRRFPAVFVFLEMPARAVDVNVHPSKTEVRFRRPAEVHGLVTRALRGALSRSKPLASLPREKAEKRSAAPTPSSQAATLESLDRALRRRRERAEPRIDFQEPREAESQAEMPAQSEVAQKEAASEETEPQRFRVEGIDPRDLVPLGQIRDSYIVVRFSGGMMLVDQHAAHERVLFEQLSRAAAGGQPAAQRLLHPLVVDLPPAQARIVESRAEDFAALGFEVEEFGPGSVALRSMPASIDPDMAEELLSGMAADLESFGRASPEKLRKQLVISAACQGAIKINTPLSGEKMRWLLDELFRCEMPMRCPHGRPVVLTFGEDDLRRRFGRS
jgi:DNA mismatch repair protein MutL